MSDLEKDLEIDQHDLDSECVKQASLFFYHSNQAAKLEREKDLKKEELELVKAELDTEIRNHPEKFITGVKITESVINSLVLQQESYKKTSKAYLEAKFNATTANIGVKAFDHKKKALENLVQLYLSTLWAEPKEKVSMIRPRGGRKSKD